MRILHIAIFLGLFETSAEGSIIVTNSTPYTQNFDTLVSTGTSSVIPAGWGLVESGASATVNGLYAAGTGSSATGDTYSFGATAATDRALGELTSGTFSSTFGASFTNGASTSIDTLSIDYWGEQWRIGNTGAARLDSLDFQYSLNASSLTTGTWSDFNSLDFLNPIKSAAGVGALDGNASANRTHLTGALTGLTINSGQSIWIRWLPGDASGNDDGLAIDDFSLTANFAPVTASVPEPGTFGILALSGIAWAALRRRAGYKS